MAFRRSFSHRSDEVSRRGRIHAALFVTNWIYGNPSLMPKRVLITGGAGFIAHHLVDHLLKNTDWEIVSLDRLDLSGNLNRLGDMLSESDAATRKRVEVVFHDPHEMVCEPDEETRVCARRMTEHLFQVVASVRNLDRR
ncbi:hypothetical protein BH10ACI2_BH10ACI2_25800 [soil metagenome]